MEFEIIDHLSGTNMSLNMGTIYARQPHFHNDIELIMPVRGSICFHTGKDSYVIKKDEMWLLSQNEVHFANETHEDNILLILEVCPNFCKEIYPRLSRMHIYDHHITKNSNPKLYSALHTSIKNIAKNCVQRQEGYKLLISSSLNLFVYSILKYANTVELTQSELNANARNRKRLTHIIEYLQKNYMHPVSLADLAVSEGLNPSYLSRFITDNLGISFRDYVNTLRLDKAISLLTSTNLKKADICAECGFSDYRYLNKEIYSKYACSPEELRKKKPVRYASRFQVSGIRAEQHKLAEVECAYTHLDQYLQTGELNYP